MKHIKYLSLAIFSMIVLISCGNDSSKDETPETVNKPELKKMMLHEATVEIDVMQYISDCKINPGNSAEMTLKTPDEADFNADDFLGPWAAGLFYKVPILEKLTIHAQRNGENIVFSISRPEIEEFWGIELSEMKADQWKKFRESEFKDSKLEEYITKFSKPE